MGQDLHVEGQGTSTDLLSDLAEADDAQRPAAQLRTDELAPSPLASTDGCVRGRNAADQRQHQRHGVLRGGDRIAGRGVYHHHPRSGRCVQVDLVDADAGYPDHRQAWRTRPQHVGVDSRLRADLGKDLEQLAGRQVQADIGLVAMSKSLDARRRDGLDNQNASHGRRESSGAIGIIRLRDANGSAADDANSCRCPATRYASPSR